MFPVIISLGPFKVYTYGLFVAAGVFAALGLALRIARYRKITPEFINNLFVGMVVCGIAGARALYVIMSFDEYIGTPYRMFMFWEGGLVFFGGFIGGCLWIIYSCRRWNVDLWSTADVLAPALALGHAIGRIGCFFAGCCYGKPSGGWPGICFTHPQTLASPLNIPLHPTQLYSSLYLFALCLFLLNRLRSSRSRISSVFGLYLVSYCSFRILIEFLRADFRGAGLLGLTLTQLTAAAGIIMGMYILKRRGSLNIG